MAKLLYIPVWFLWCLLSISEAARILAVFPTPSISHQVVFRSLTQELVRRGHEVIVITTDPAFPKGKTPENLTEIDVHEISYTTWRKALFSGSTVTGKKDDLLTQMKVMLNTVSAVFEEQLTSDEVQKLIKHENQFDLLLLEACARPALVFSHVFKAPTILVSSFGSLSDIFKIFGMPTHPLLYPDMLRQRLNNLTIMEKLTELYNHFAFETTFSKQETTYNEMIKRVFGPDTPSLKEMNTNVDMVFLNVHPLWENNRPVPPSVVYLGGLHLKPEKELPKDLKFYLDSSKNGVVYVSFGTNVKPSMLPPERIQMLVNVLSQLPYDILWKWDKDELPGRTDNIKIAKWLPQSDLLRHAKVKAFITQGGLQSTDEAIIAGVPLIGIPMLGDQWYNVEQYVHHKIGIRVDMDTLTTENLRNAVITIVEDESYRRNVARLRSLMHDQPQRPLDRAVWWTEHVLRHGGAHHLRAPAHNMSWVEYLELEFVAVLLISLLIILLVICITMNCIWRCVSQQFVTTIKIKSA